MEEWATKQVWPSLEAVDNTLKCPRPHAGSGGLHWWYNDWRALERLAKDGPPPHIPIVCKTCDLKLKLSPDAEDGPEI